MEYQYRRIRNAYEEKDIDEAGRPDWVYGCRKCKGGLISAPSIAKMLAPTYLARVFQAQHGLLTFCDCRAGLMYRQHMRRVLKEIEANDDQLPPAYRQNIEDEVTSPTVNGEKVFA